MATISISISKENNRPQFDSLARITAYGWMYHGLLVVSADKSEARIEAEGGHEAVIADEQYRLTFTYPGHHILLERGLPDLPVLDYGHPARALWNRDIAFTGPDMTDQWTIDAGLTWARLFYLPPDSTAPGDVRTPAFSRTVVYNETTGREDGFRFEVWIPTVPDSLRTLTYFASPSAIDWPNSRRLVPIDVAPGMNRILVGSVQYDIATGVPLYAIGARDWLVDVFEVEMNAPWSEPAISQVATWEDSRNGALLENTVTPSETRTIYRILDEDGSHDENSTSLPACNPSSPSPPCVARSANYPFGGERRRRERVVVGAVYDRDAVEPVLSTLLVDRADTFVGEVPVWVSGYYVQPFVLTQTWTLTATVLGVDQPLGTVVVTSTQTSAGGSVAVTFDGETLVSDSWTFGELAGDQIGLGISSAFEPLDPRPIQTIFTRPGIGSVRFGLLQPAWGHLLQAFLAHVNTGDEWVEYLLGPLATPFGLDEGWQRSGNLWGAHPEGWAGEVYDEEQAAKLRSFLAAIQNPITGQVVRNTTDGDYYRFC